MKDLYDKTCMNSRLSGLFDGLVRQVRQIPYDIRDIFRAAGKRPVVIPAVLLLTCSFLSFYTASVMPSVFLCIFMAAICCFIAFLRDRSRTELSSVLLTGLMICVLLLYNGIFISSRLNARAGSESLKCVVTKVNYDLSGGADVTVRLEEGALAKVNFYCDHGELGPGDILILDGRLKEPDKPGNPGEFDYRGYLRKQGICYTVSCSGYVFAGKAGFPLNVTGFLRKGFFEFRKMAFEAVTASFDDTYKALASAVCLGDRSLIPDDISRDFSLSCCSHLLAVSGTHFSGFLVCLPVFLDMAGIRRRYRLPVHV